MSVSQEEFFGSGGLIVQSDVTQSTPESLARVEEVSKGATQSMTPEEFFGDTGPIPTRAESQEEKLNFAQRLGEDILKRNVMLNEINDAILAGEQGYAEGAMQVIGKVGFGSVLDLIGEGLVSGIRGLDTVTPDTLKRPLKFGATVAGIEFLNTTIGRKGLNAAKRSLEDWINFKEKNPRSARNIEAIVNIALIAVPIKGKPKTTTPTVIGETAAKLETKATEQIVRTKEQFVDDLVRPKQTASVKLEQTGRTTEGGILRQKIVASSPAEQAIAKQVAEVPGVSAKKTLQGNLNAISKEVSNEGQRLVSALKANEVIIPKREFAKVLDDTLKNLKANPLIVGDAEKTAQKIVSKMKSLVNAGKSTGSGLLRARKDLDKWISSQKGGKIFDPKNENALSIAVRDVRTATNNFIEQRVTNVAVKESLKRQSNLFRAMDNIGPKAVEEAGNVIFRAWQNITRILPLRGEFNQTLALIFGVGGLGAAAMFAPMFKTGVMLTGGIYTGTRIVRSAAMKKGISKLLTQVDRAIRNTKDANLIRELRVDRAALLELLKEGEGRLRNQDSDQL